MIKIYLLALAVVSQVCSKGTWQEVANHPAWRVLSKFDCGISASDRIIGGTNAALGQFPWIALLGYQDNGEISWWCGGSLISDRLIATAGHCVEGEQKALLQKIRLGEHNTKTEPDCQVSMCAPPVQDRLVKRVNIHPQYNNPKYQNDIAIIDVTTPFNLNDYVAPICLPRSQEQFKTLNKGEMVTTAGWGKVNMSTSDYADVVQVLVIPVLDPTACNHNKSSSRRSKFQSSGATICAGGQRNKDSCVGDSGGPLMKTYDTEEGPVNVLVGIVSFGPTLCGNKKPGVYTSTVYFLNWILDNILM